MIVISHDGISGDINEKDRRELLNPILNPAPSMLKAISRAMVSAAQESTANTTCCAMIVKSVIKRHKLLAWAGHSGIPICMHIQIKVISVSPCCQVLFECPGIFGGLRMSPI